MRDSLDLIMRDSLDLMPLRRRSESLLDTSTRPEPDLRDADSEDVTGYHT